jgi:hypothetical protein
MQRWLGVWVAVALSGSGACGDDEPRGAEPRADGGGRPATAELLEDWTREWDREAMANCRCFVADGRFETIEACMALHGSGPSWVECASAALESIGTDGGEFDARCLIEERARRAQCLETSACDADTIHACLGAGMTCPPIPTEIVVRALERCPDLGLLSRLGAAS